MWPLSSSVGPEVIAGSTRLKAGTATKIVLNMLTTAAMVRAGKTYGNLMVDVKSNSDKLRDRARRIIGSVTGLDYDAADELLQRAQLEREGGHPHAADRRDAREGAVTVARRTQTAEASRPPVNPESLRRSGCSCSTDAGCSVEMRPLEHRPTARAFSRPGRNQHDGPRLEHRADSHRQRFARHAIEPAAEERRVRAAGLEREPRAVAARVQGARGLVEADVRVAADAEQQQIHSSERRLSRARTCRILPRDRARRRSENGCGCPGRLMRVNRCFCMNAQ